jgi:hypothetical protein
LDVLCGFMLLDDHCRTVVVEGLAGAVSSMLAKVSEVVPRAANDRARRVLANQHVRFQKRLYTVREVGRGGGGSI